MTYRLDIELRAARQVMAETEQDRRLSEVRGDKHMVTLLTGQLIGQRRHIESLERIKAHEEEAAGLNQIDRTKEKHAV